jgi:tetratricopeptide (TPR) repeat protein
LASHSEIKLERYRKAIETCESILSVEENYEAFIVKASSLAALSMFPEAIVCYKRAQMVLPGD